MKRIMVKGICLFTVFLLNIGPVDHSYAQEKINSKQSGEGRMKQELEKLQGTWNVVSLEIEGMKMEEPAFKGAKIVVKDDTFTTTSMGAVYKGTLSADSAKTPKTLDLSFTEGPERGNTSLAIYELEGDTWKLCLTVSGNGRPKEFVTTPGSGHALESLKLEK